MQVLDRQQQPVLARQQLQQLEQRVEQPRLRGRLVVGVRRRRGRARGGSARARRAPPGTARANAGSPARASGRSAPTIGAYGSSPSPSSTQSPPITRMPSARAARSSSPSSRVLPTPDSPATNASDGRPVDGLGHRGPELLELRGPADEAWAGQARGHELQYRAARRRIAGSGIRRRWRGTGTRAASWRARAGATSGGGADDAPSHCLTRRTSTPYRCACTEAPYGTWRSPIDGDAVARDRGWTYSLVTAAGGAVYWSEARPLEGGRDAIVVAASRRPPADAIPARCNARTRVHEYGGGAFTVHDGTVYFCHDADQRVYRHGARRRAGADHAAPGACATPTCA